jgi:hypothetical protein
VPRRLQDSSSIALEKTAAEGCCFIELANNHDSELAIQAPSSRNKISKANEPQKRLTKRF